MTSPANNVSAFAFHRRLLSITQLCLIILLCSASPALAQQGHFDGADCNQIGGWVSRFVTTVANPDDLTLIYFPFKAYSVEVNPVEGKIGWYHCNLSVLPHIQFEGMDVDLRVDARLGG